MTLYTSVYHLLVRLGRRTYQLRYTSCKTHCSDDLCHASIFLSSCLGIEQ